MKIVKVKITYKNKSKLIDQEYEFAVHTENKIAAARKALMELEAMDTACIWSESSTLDFKVVDSDIRII